MAGPGRNQTGDNTGRQEWRIAPTVSQAMLVIAPIAVIFLSAMMWQARGILFSAGLQQSPIELLVLLALFGLVPAYFALVFARGWIDCFAARSDDLPRLVADAEGLHERRFLYHAMGFRIRTTRWSAIEDVTLTYAGPLMQPERRRPRHVRIKVRDSARPWTIDPLGLLGEDRKALFDAIDAAWRKHTRRAPRP